ncbi:MAG: hypothetical protein ACOX61_03395 [Brooklawnia sp.]|jgi:hypothetical protein
MKQTEVSAATYDKTKNTVKVALLAMIALGIAQFMAVLTRKRGE